MQTLSPLEFKTCCADTYSQKTVLFLLGPSLHPGGLGLTKKLADELELSSEDTVLDVASGTGSTASFLSTTYQCQVHGVDLSRPLVKHASVWTRDCNACFVQCDGENLPFRSEEFTVAISECSLCLFPDFQRGLSEIQRTLKPGGRLGVTDFAVEGTLPEELNNVLMSFLCLSRELSRQDYAVMVEDAGFENVHVTNQSASLRHLLDGIKKRIMIAELLLGTGKPSLPSDQIARGKRLLSLAEASVKEGSLSYLMLTAEKA